MICPTGEAKYFCKGDSTQKCPTGKSLHGSESTSVVSRMEINPSFRGAPLGASPESITTTGSMDSGPAPSGASTMCNCTSGNDERWDFSTHATTGNVHARPAAHLRSAVQHHPVQPRRARCGGPERQPGV